MDYNDKLTELLYENFIAKAAYNITRPIKNVLDKGFEWSVAKFLFGDSEHKKKFQKLILHLADADTKQYKITNKDVDSLQNIYQYLKDRNPKYKSPTKVYRGISLLHA